MKKKKEKKSGQTRKSKKKLFLFSHEFIKCIKQEWKKN